jgi:hypothetical protein
MRPAKQFDDIIDCLRASAADEVRAEIRTPAEEIETCISPNLRQEEVAQYYGQPGFIELMLARGAEQRQIEMQIEEERRHHEDNLRNIFSSGGRVRLLGNRRR